MGGRGAGSGIEPYPGRGGRLFRYGEEFRTLWISDEIKYVTVRNPDESPRMPRETRTPGRVYALIGTDGSVKAIGIYGKDGRIEAQIDLDHLHGGLKPHVHRDAWHHDGGKPLDAGEKALVGRVLEQWSKYNGQKQP